MSYAHEYLKHLKLDFFKFDVAQAVKQANDTNVNQDASIAQVAAVDQELNQAVVQNNEQNTVVSVEGGDNVLDLDADLLDLGLGLGGGDVDVDVTNVNNQTGFNIGANTSVIDQVQLAAIDQEQDVGIGQFNFAGLDAFGG